MVKPWREVCKLSPVDPARDGCCVGTERWLSDPRGLEELRDAARAAESSGGFWSAGGIGSPLAAATSWFSVQESSWSWRPCQNGASRRSIYVQSVAVVRIKELFPTYHQLPHDWFTKVLSASVRAQRNQISTINPLLSGTPLSLHFSCRPLFLKFPRISFGSRLPPLRGIWRIGTMRVT